MNDRAEPSAQTLTVGRALAGVYRILTLLIFAGVLAQVYAAGLMWYGVPGVHRRLGWMVMAGAFLCIPTSFAARPYGANPLYAFVLVGLMSLQPVFVFSLARVSPHLGAAHALNAGLILVLSARMCSRALKRTCRPA